MNDKKKIVWQAHEGNVSGANIATLEYIDVLATQFSSFMILPHEGSMQEALEQRNISYIIIRQYGWTNVYTWWKIGKWIKCFLRSIKAVWQTKQLLKKEKPTLVCTTTLVPFTASIAAKLQSIAHVWWIHEFGKEDFGFTTGWGHEKTSLRWIQCSSKLIICNSNAIRSKFEKLMPKVNIATIYQPVSWHASKVTASIKKAKFLMFGQIVESKGHKQVLQAMLRNKERGKPLHHLHIKGPCEMKNYFDELQAFVQNNDLSQYVRIEQGYFKKEEVIPHYDVLIVASQSEAFGRVIVEANKAGLRVLVRNSGGAAELINDSNGLLFNDELELAAALCGELIFPVESIRSNYDELSEIQKLTELLITSCS